MSDGVISLIGTVGVGIIAAITTLIGYIYTRKDNNHKIFSQNVSNTRNEWLNRFRESVSIMLAEADKTQKGYKSLRYYEFRNDLITRLNMHEKLHLLLYDLILYLDNCNSKNYLYFRDEILRVSQIIIKQEWEKVKFEARGGEDMMTSKSKYVFIFTFIVTALTIIYFSIFLGIIFVSDNKKIWCLTLTSLIFAIVILVVYVFYCKKINNIDKREKIIEYTKISNVYCSKQEDILKKIEENHMMSEKK